MKSYGQLWDRITSEENLFAAWKRVKKGHARSKGVKLFSDDIRGELLRLRVDLRSGTYQPAAYHQFKIFDPKLRTISCASVRDRIVHQSLCGIVMPLLEKGFSNASFACRKGYGSHRACLLARRYTKRFHYFCKMDIRHYFDSVNHEILLGLLQKKFRESAVNDLIRKIVQAPVEGLAKGVGLPVGNLTSQWFANIYLDAFDHAVLYRISSGRVAYVRYMDDIVFFADSKADLWSLHDWSVAWLAGQRCLEVKSEATVLAPTSEGLTFLGLRIFGGCWRLRRARLDRTRRTFRIRIRQYERGLISEERFSRCVTSLDGGLRWFGFKGILAPGQSAESGSARAIRGYNNRNNNNYNATSFYRYGDVPSSNRNNNGNNTYLGFRLSSTLSGQCQGPARDASALRVAETNMHGFDRPVAQATVTSAPFCMVEMPSKEAICE